MFKLRVVTLAVVIVVRIMSVPLVNADTIQAPTCSRVDVQATIDAAVSGDTVIIPAGSATWTSGVSIPNSKNIALIGAGSNVTVIISGMSSSQLLQMNFSTSRVSGIQFVLTGSGEFAISVRGQNWRIDNCRFGNTTGNRKMAIFANGSSTSDHPVGVIDHCVFEPDIRVYVHGDQGLLAHREWAKPLGLGTNNAVFIEDCVFNRTQGGNTIDSHFGGRYVFRYNTVSGSYPEMHSVAENARATRSWEVYENTFDGGTVHPWTMGYVRGGTGVYFNNTYTGTWEVYGIAMDNRRSWENVSYPPGVADGTSPWDGNTAPTETYKGWPARDQIGRGSDEWLWTDANPYPPQASDPAYFWNNKHGDNDVVPYLANTAGDSRVAMHIQEGRDYFVGIPRPGYTPYTYPHPLIEDWEAFGPGGGEISTPAAPSGLRVQN